MIWAHHQVESRGTPDDHRSNVQPANGHREQFKSIRAFGRADPSPKLNKTLTQAGRQAGRQVDKQAGRQAGRRGPSPEPDEMTTVLKPDDHYQNQTIVARTRRPP